MGFIGSAVVTGTRTCATLVVEPVRSLRWSARVEFGCICFVGCSRKSLSLLEMVVFQEADCNKVQVLVAVRSRGRKLELEASITNFDFTSIPLSYS